MILFYCLPLRYCGCEPFHRHAICRVLIRALAILEYGHASSSGHAGIETQADNTHLVLLCRCWDTGTELRGKYMAGRSQNSRVRLFQRTVSMKGFDPFDAESPKSVESEVLYFPPNHVRPQHSDCRFVRNEICLASAEPAGDARHANSSRLPGARCEMRCRLKLTVAS